MMWIHDPPVEDLRDGLSLPSQILLPTREHLRRYAAAVGEMNPPYPDVRARSKRGEQGLVVPETLKAEYLAKMIDRWIGHSAFIRSMALEYLGVDVADRPLICKGTIISTNLDVDTRNVDLKVWIENTFACHTVTGYASVGFG